MWMQVDHHGEHDLAIVTTDVGHEEALKEPEVKLIPHRESLRRCQKAQELLVLA